MKKSIIVLLCLIAGTVSVQAQTFILKAGTSLSSVSFSDNWPGGDHNAKSKWGFIGGVGYEFLANKKLSLQPELLFVQKGYKTSHEGSPVDFKSATVFNYLELPILAKIKLGRFYINIGPYLAYGIGGSYLGYSSGTEYSGRVKFGKPDGYGDVMYFHQAFDFGMSGGVGVNLGPVIFDIRYGYGFLDMQQYFNGSLFDYKSQNRTFQFTMGVPLVLKK
jgi:hypothetical protein